MDIFVYWLGMAAVAVSAFTGVVEAERKEIDLVGATFVAVATALGGGTLRDLLLSRHVFWVADQTYLLTAAVCGIAIFFVMRRRRVSQHWFLYPDALALALFTVVGTQIALGWKAPWLVASLMGVVTAVFGGVLRDILCNELPLVMRPGELYATAAWAGSLCFIGLRAAEVPMVWASALGMLTVLALRVAAIRYHLTLPYLEQRRKP